MMRVYVHALFGGDTVAAIWAVSDERCTNLL
jgi:hypothetical protein